MLTPGLFARVRLPGSGQYDAVLIPDLAIVSDQSAKFVFVVSEDGTIRRQQVEIAGVSHGLRIVRGGLTGDEKIIVRGLQRVRPGLKAKATVETLVAKNDAGLPDHYQPVPESEWISARRELPAAGAAFAGGSGDAYRAASIPATTAAAPKGVSAAGAIPPALRPFPPGAPCALPTFSSNDRSSPACCRS